MALRFFVKRFLLLALVALVALITSAGLRAADAKRHVVFCTASEYVAYPQVSTEEFDLVTDRFCLSPDEGHGHANVEGFRAALANTRLLVLGPQQDGAQPAVDLIFADPANREAVKAFLRSGGTLVLDGTPTHPTEFAKFLGEVGVAPPKPGSPPPLAKKGEVQLLSPAKEGPDARHPLVTAPNAFARDLNPRVASAYAGWDAKQLAPLRFAKNPALAALVVQEGVFGAGRVIFNQAGIFGSTKADGGLLAENLYSYALGAAVRRVPPPRSRYVVKGGWKAWGKDPYAPFPLDRDAPGKAALEALALTAAVNERLSAEVLLTNAPDAPAAEIGIACGELRSAEGALPPVVVRELVFDRPDGMHPDPLPETKGFTLAPGETRPAWLTVDTFGARPGEYRGELALTPAGGAARKLAISVRVLPIVLPVENPLRFTTWELFFGWRDKLVEGRENWKHYQQDLVDHGVSVFHVVFDLPPKVADPQGNAVFAPDAFAKVRDRFLTPDKRSLYLIYGNIEAPFSAKDKGGAPLPFPSPEHARAYKGYVAETIRFLKGLGLGYDQFAFYPYDEIAEAKVPNALINYAAIKEVDPQARIFLTLGGHSVAEFFEAKEGRPVKDLAPFVDIWCPGIGFYSHFGNPNSETARRVAKVLEFCKETGREVWSYNVTTRSSYELAPYQRYRLKPWGAYALGLGGYGFFGINQWKDDTYTAIYPGPRPVPSIRWEAVREGMNDVKYMVVLREEIARAKQAGKATAPAEALLARALKEVNEKSLDASLAPAYREKIAAMVLELRK